MLALDIAGGLDGPHNTHLILPWDELLILILFLGLFEQYDPTVIHQIFQKLLLLRLKEIPSLILQITHLLNLLMVIINTKIPLSPINDHNHSLLDILKGLKRLQQVLSKFW